MPRLIASVVPVWVLALAGAVIVGVLAAPSLTWLPIVLAVCVLVTFAVQLAVARKEGLVTRMIASIGGAVVIVGLATAILAVARLG
ncbi:MAG TPA: hypothetical protein VN759_09690 [Pseudolysinimonas sp.]|nr:hypothetical protein [Pseudolysinimonas sp.]